MSQGYSDDYLFLSQKMSKDNLSWDYRQLVGISSSYWLDLPILYTFATNA